MKATINTKELLKALHTTGECKTNRTTLPFLQHVKLEVSGPGQMSFTTTDLEVCIRYTALAATEEAGVCTVNHKELLDLAKLFTSKSVTFDYSEDGILRIVAGSCGFTCEGESVTDASEYPNVPFTLETVDTMDVDVAAFTAIVKHVVVAAADDDDDSRPVLTSVKMEWDNDVLTLVAADAFRMAAESMDLPGSWETYGHPLVPARTIKIVAKRMPKQGWLTIEQNGNQIGFRSGQVEVQSRLIEGTYPDYRYMVRLTETAKTTLATCRERFLDAVKQLAPIAKEASQITRFRIYPDEPVMYVLAQKDGMEEPAVVQVLAEAEGEEIEVVLNNFYVKNFLTALKDHDAVQLHLQTPNKPVKFTVPTCPSYVGVLMTMHINR